MKTKKLYEAPHMELCETMTEQTLATSGLTLPDPHWSDPVNW